MHDPMPPPARSAAREPVIDAAKVLATLLIMGHHFSLYGPLSDAGAQVWPELSRLLSRYGRYAVQVFLVAAGYLAAQGLMGRPPVGLHGWAVSVAQRWWRLATPFAVTLVLTLLAYAATAPWLPELLPGEVGGWRLLAHALLVQDLVGVEALTVGGWYVAIDLQLFALLGLLLVVSEPALAVPGLRWALIAGLALVSLWVFNRMAHWDHLALYFFGSYGLGVAAARLRAWPAVSAPWTAGVALMAIAVCVALLLEWRGRLLWAAATAAMLLAVPHRVGSARSWASTAWSWLAERSYALFLVHFAACLTGNALYVAVRGPSPSQGLVAGIGLAMCGLAFVMADLLYRCIERPARRVTWRMLAR